MSGLKRPPTLAVGNKIRFEGQVRGVLEVTAQAAVVEDAEAPHRVVALLDMFEAADFEVVSPTLVRLRGGRGEARTYTVVVTCRDGAGSVTTRSTQVTVRHSAREGR